MLRCGLKTRRLSICSFRLEPNGGTDSTAQQALITCRCFECWMTWISAQMSVGRCSAMPVLQSIALKVMHDNERDDPVFFIW